MRAILLLSVFAFTSAQAATIAKITTLRGKSYRQCEIVTVHPDGVSFTHANGAAKVLFTDLSREWQSKLGYNSKKAAAYQKQIADKRLQIAAAKVKREQELTQAMAEAERAARFRELGLAAQANAARTQSLAKVSAQPVFPVLPTLGPIFDGRSIQGQFARPYAVQPWHGGFYGNYPGSFGYGVQFSTGFNYSPFFGFGACPPIPYPLPPPVTRHTIIVR